MNNKTIFFLYQKGKKLFKEHPFLHIILKIKDHLSVNTYFIKLSGDRAWVLSLKKRWCRKERKSWQ